MNFRIGRRLGAALALEAGIVPNVSRAYPCGQMMRGRDGVATPPATPFLFGELDENVSFEAYRSRQWLPRSPRVLTVDMRAPFGVSAPFGALS